MLVVVGVGVFLGGGGMVRWACVGVVGTSISVAVNPHPHTQHVRTPIAGPHRLALLLDAAAGEVGKRVPQARVDLQEGVRAGVVDDVGRVG